MSLTAMWHLEWALARGTDRDDLLCRVTMLCIVTIRRHHVVSVIGQASWMVVVVRKSCVNCWLHPNQASAFANIHFGLDQSRAWLSKGSSLCSNGRIVQLLEHSCSCAHDTSAKSSVQFLMVIVFLMAHLMGFSMEFDVDCSMESIWNSTWICDINSLEIPWNPYGMHHSMDIPYGFHRGYGMKKWVGLQPKNIPYGFHGMGLDSTHSIWSPYGTYGGV